MKKMITTRTFSFWMSLTTLVLIAGADFKARAAAPASVPTFHCISLYWTPASVDTTREVLVKYRITGTQQWYEALPLVYNQVTTSPLQKALYRGSIVNLTPGTSYEITLKEAGTGTGVEEVTLSETTLSENFPGSTVFTLTATRTTPLSITASGTAAAYQIYDGNGQTIDLGNTGAVGITVDADYVVIRNFTIKNTTRHGIQLLGQHHHIVIENCDISKWGSRDNGSWTYDNGTPNDPSDDKSGPNQTSETDFGMNDQSAIYAYNTWDGPAASNLVIQRNKLHHPNHDTNNWSELHGTPYNGDNGKHPNGPGVVYLQNSGGNNIIRFNEIYSDATHFFNDGIGGRVNTSLRGYPGTDSDIYGNYISFCHDDAFEIEGGGQNIRIWNNFVENTLQGIANACVRIGPIYVWRNVYGKGTTVAGGGVRSLYSIKMGWSGGIENITGYQYYFNNTYLQPNDEGYGGIGTMGSLTSNRVIRHVTTRNNILQARSTAQQAISQDSRNRNNDFDYDLISTPESSFPAGHETHGISGLPGYITGWGFSGTPGTTALTGIFRIGNDTPGKDAAQIVPNFSDVYTGAGPDVGAHEGKSADMQFGVAATFTPNHLAAQPITFTSASTKTYGDAPFTLAATSPSGLPVTYSLVSGPATLSGATLTITGAGTIVVKAHVPANGVYAANEQEQTIAVNKASQTITFAAVATKTYGDAPFNLVATASSGLAAAFSVVSGPATVSGATLTITGAGTVVVSASQAGDANYSAAAPVEQNITVNKAAQTIAFSAVSDKTYPATTTVPLTATATSGLTPTFSVVSGPATVSGATLTLTGTGTVVVRAGQAGNGNYLAAAPVDRSFTVTSSAVYSGTLEAENAVLQGAFVATSQTGYTGAGFADYANATGDYIQWTVTANTAGSAYLKFRYANGGTTNRPLELRVNGAVVSGPGLPFAPSGGWSTWVNQTVTVGLNAGSNTIRLSTIGTHGPNVDHLAYEILQSGTLEAEDAFLSGVTFSNYNAGYTGTGYGNYNNINTDYIEWTVNKANASQVNLKFRYANGYAENRPLKLTVNGTVVASGLAFNPTGSWTTWTTTSGINANLVSGENRIRLTATSVMGVNMDHLSFTSSPSANPVARIASQESPADQAVDQLRVSVFPNPASGRATLAISSPVNTALEIKLVNIMGRVVQMLQKQPEGQSAEMSISVQDLPPGLYSIQVKQGHRCTQTKLVVR